jgi:hypothetical protein
MVAMGGGTGIHGARGCVIQDWQSQPHRIAACTGCRYRGSHCLCKTGTFVSYLDVFRVMGMLALVVWPIVLFLRAPVRRVA